MVSLLVTIVFVVFVFFAANWAIDYMAPGHPVVINRALWFFCVVVVVLLLVNSFGVADLPVPQLR